MYLCASTTCYNAYYVVKTVKYGFLGEKKITKEEFVKKVKLESDLKDRHVFHRQE